MHVRLTREYLGEQPCVLAVIVPRKSSAVSYLPRHSNIKAADEVETVAVKASGFYNLNNFQHTCRIAVLNLNDFHAGFQGKAPVPEPGSRAGPLQIGALSTKRLSLN